MIKPWEIIDRQVAYSCPIFKIQKKRVCSPRTGRILEVQAIQTPAWVMVLALTPQQEVVMVRQYRHGIEKICLELPGGLLDPGDASAEITAQRELLEETGYQAVAIKQIGRCHPQPAVLSNECFFFIGYEAVPAKAQTMDAGEDVEIVTVPLATIPEKIQQRQITHGMVMLAFFYYGMSLGKLGGSWDQSLCT
jgi:8-oxo-dGTP pyrophosphatase MutT (NUDIX family)